MPEPFATRVLPGALVQLIPEFGTVTPSIVVFQYNPEKVTRSMMPWNPFEVDQTKRGAAAPMVQPYDPEETFEFTLEFDATDALAEGGQLLAEVTGVAPQLAALKKLTMPTSGLVSDLVSTARSLAGGASAAPNRATIPVTILVLGRSLALPVRVTSLSTEIKEFTPSLQPLMAEATLGLRVLTPDAFRCRKDPGTRLALAAYEATKTQEAGLALASAVNDVAVVPFLGQI